MAVNKNPETKNQDGYFCEYGYWHSHTPNAETIAAFEETEEIIKRIEAGEKVRTYSSFAELLAEIDAEIETEDGTEI